MIAYRIPGLKKAQEAFQLAPGQIVERDAIAIDTSLDLLKQAVQPNVQTGPGHFGFHAKDKIFTRVATGRRVVGLMYTVAAQLRWGEEGTKPHLITAKGGQELRLSGGLGGAAIAFVDAVHHPGQKPTHLFRLTLAAMKTTIRAVFVGSTQKVIEDLARRAQ